MRASNKYLRYVWLVALGLCLVLLLGAALDARDVVLGQDVIAEAATATVTVSGTVTGVGPVEGCWIGIGSPQDWQETTTNASGSYSTSIQTDGELRFHVRPGVASGLSQANLWLDSVTSDLTQDFSLVNGHLLGVQVVGSGGGPISGTGDLGFEVQSLANSLPDGWWYSLEWDDASQHYQAVLPPDVYYVTVQRPPAGYYETTRAFDLRTTDLSADLPLNTTYVHPIPYDPPDATRITIGSPDGLGEAAVSGVSGAALPLARVLLVNLNSGHQAHTTTEADGSFAARIYAPPGSAIMIKHGPASHRWRDLEVGVSEGINPFPGTIINVHHSHTGDGAGLPFAGAGAIDLHADDPAETRNYVGAAWAVTGTISPVVVKGEWTRVLTGTYNGEVVPGLYLGGLNWTHPTLGDLDADGDLELLVGERSGRLVLYRNYGSSTVPDWKFEASGYAGVDTGGWAYPALADVTGDGALDLLVGSGDGVVSIFYNDGTPALPIWPASPDASLVAGGPAAPSLTDLDNNGTLDLVAGHEGGTLHFYRNTGTSTNPAWVHESSAYGGISEPDHGLQPAFVDLDGDTDLDLLIGRGGDLVWYRNNGPPEDPGWTRVTDSYIGFEGSSAVSPAIGDWNGDLDDDLVTGEHWGVLRFFRNESPPNWIEEDFSFPFDLSGDTAPALADWNGDGDQDLLVGQAHGLLHQYTNVGDVNNPHWRPDGVAVELPEGNHPHPFPTFADIDGDNLDELFVGVGGWEGPGAGGTIRHYHNDGTPSAPSWTLVSDSFLGLDVGGWSTPVFADIDADNDLDLFVGDSAGTLTFVENTGAATTPAWATPVHPYAGLEMGEYSAPAFLDVDEDGDLDILVGLGRGSLALVENVGAADSPAWDLISTTYPGIHVGEHATPAAADLNGDTKPDLLIGDGDGGLNLYLYEGPGTTAGADSGYAPGSPFQVEGKVRLYSPAITATTDVEAIAVQGWMDLMMLFDQDGRALAAENYFMSSMLTPTGFPIQRVGRAGMGLGLPVTVDDLGYSGGHVVEGDVRASGQVPVDLPAGIYRPTIWLEFTGVPTSTDWLAANVVRYTLYEREVALPPITIGDVDPPSLVWRLLMDDIVQGTRGTPARQDRDSFGLASQVVSQGARYYTPAADARTGQPIIYRLEPFLPMVSFTDRRMPTPPLIPFALPGGQLHVEIQQPDGSVRDLGREPFAQSFNRTKTTRDGSDLNIGTVQLDDVYSLQTGSDRFRVAFEQYGHHVITMTGGISDTWGSSYSGGGTYDVWVAYPLDIDPGVLPGTPLAVGDSFNPTLQFYPRVPANVTLTVTLYANSNPAQMVVRTISGTANRFGSFARSSSPIILSAPGEYRVDLTADYTNASGELYMGSMAWGGVVMTPQGKADLVAHGRRGLDSLGSIPPHWFVASRDLTIPEGAVSHALNPYDNGDILWSRMSDGQYGGDSLVLGASVQDTTAGAIEAAIQNRASRMNLELAPPGSLNERVSVGELPLFISTRSGQAPQLVLGAVGGTVPDDIDQIAYSYRFSQRPGVRVRELVAEDGQSGGYWRLDTLYDDQLGVGVQGDQVNDFKFQYVGAVYRDFDTGRNEYLGQGSGWIFIPDEDSTGTRVMPPYAGYGAWTNEGGPIMTLKGEDIHIFILPTGTRPGAVLEVGDMFRFAGHMMPTLDSRVVFTATAPNGTPHYGGGQANRIGHFYDADDDLEVDEPGLWSVDVRVWHDGQIGDGENVLCASDPSELCPKGDVLGSENGRFWFYVVPQGSPRLDVSTPAPGFLSFSESVTPITVSGQVPPGLSGVTVDYTISMPGTILEQGQVEPSGDTYEIQFDPAALHMEFPNLDLVGRDMPGRAGLADTFAIGLMLTGERDGTRVYRANTVTVQGDQVFTGDTSQAWSDEVYLPLVLKGR